MRKCLIVLLAIATLNGAELKEIASFEPYIDLPLKPIKTSADRIREHGYPAESHYIETPDGYVLNVFRIPYSPRLNNQNSKRPVVFIMHGQFSCSDCYLLNGPDNALAFNFADAGYDVWLGNARGNIYSRNNTKISEKHPKFWSFSWHEIGVIDIPTTIDYILNETGESKLHYVGHSQGTTVFFVMTSMLPEYNEKIKMAHIMAPPIFMGNSTDGLLLLLKPYVGKPGKGSRFLENQQFVPENPFLQRMLDTACGGQVTFPDFCKMLYLLWAGTDQPNLNATLLPLAAETHPAGIATNQGIHFIQEQVSEKFRQYDHGFKENMRRYGQPEPPDYPLDKITAPLYIYYGLADSSASYLDILLLPDRVSSIKYFHEIPEPTFGHLDFIWAMRVKHFINDPIIGFCDDYERKSIN